MNESKAPFGIGQKVVCMKPTTSYAKSKVYTVASLVKCALCGKWQIGCEEVPAPQHQTECWCPCGGVSRDIRSFRHAYASRFAPYDPPRLEIPAELLEVDTKDGIDVIKEKAIA